MLTKKVDIYPFTYLSDNRKFRRFERILGGVVKGWRLVGIPLDPSSIRTPIIRYCAIGFGLFMFIFNLIANFTILISGVQSFESTTKRWNRLINEANFAITNGNLRWNIVSNCTKLEGVNPCSLSNRAGTDF